LQHTSGGKRAKNRQELLIALKNLFEEPLTAGRNPHAIAEELHDAQRPEPSEPQPDEVAILPLALDEAHLVSFAAHEEPLQELEEGELRAESIALRRSCLEREEGLREIGRRRLQQKYPSPVSRQPLPSQ
jgi:hypothetical protein